MDTNAYWYVGGQWVHPHEAVISINDMAVLRGYSVFESLRLIAVSEQPAKCIAAETN